jgi:hypothetical protein
MTMTTINTSEILSRASSKNITANELDILVSKSQELNSVRDRKIKRLQCMLEKVESQLDK